MFSGRYKTKEKVIIIYALFAFLFICAENAFTDSAAIKNITKVNRNGEYIISINYKTYDKDTDSLFFRIDCEFDRGEFVFTSSYLNNIKKGSHNTCLSIPGDIRKRYGSLRAYKVCLYKDGVLIDTRPSY